MKPIIVALAVFSIACNCGVTCADEDQPIPKLAERKRVVGLASDADDFKRLLNAYRFSENPQRENSSGWPYRVFIEVTKDNVVTVATCSESHQV